MFGGFFVAALVVLFVELSDELRIDQCDEHSLLEKAKHHLVIPENELVRVEAISVLLGVSENPGQTLRNQRVKWPKIGFVLWRHDRSVETPHSQRMHYELVQIVD